MLGRPLSAKTFFAKSWGTILFCIISIENYFACLVWDGKDKQLVCTVQIKKREQGNTLRFFAFFDSFKEKILTFVLFLTCDL